MLGRMWEGYQERDARRTSRGYRSARCQRCQQLPERCICPLLTPTPTRVGLVVVMHYLEYPRPTNTGRLAVELVENATLRLRGAPGARFDGGDLNEHDALLFPTEDAEPLDENSARSIRRLIVPDGTWGQTRRMVRREASLRGLRAVSLPPGAPSSYTLRQRAQPGQLCTLEAIARAYGLLEGPAFQQRCESVLQAAVQAGMYRRGLQDQ